MRNNSGPLVQSLDQHVPVHQLLAEPTARRDLIFETRPKRKGSGLENSAKSKSKTTRPARTRSSLAESIAGGMSIVNNKDIN